MRLFWARCVTLSEHSFVVGLWIGFVRGKARGGTTVVVEVCVCARDRKLRILSFAVKIKQFCRKFMMFLFMCSPFIMIVDIVLVHGTRVGTTLQLVTILRKTTCIKLTLGAHDSTDQIALWTEWAHVHGPGLDWNVVLWFRVRFKWVWDNPDFKNCAFHQT